MKPKFDGLRHFTHDTDIERKLVALCQEADISPVEALKHYPLFCRTVWLKRIIAHSKFLYDTVNIPGDIADIGVFRGNSLMTWAKLLEVFYPGERSKVVYGFDNWTGFAQFHVKDGKPNVSIQKVPGGFAAEGGFDTLIESISIFDSDRFCQWKPRIKLVSGDISRTVNEFVKHNPGVRFSLLHFDCDLYLPTLAALKALYPLLSVGGIALFDEYSCPDFPGESAAVDEYFKGKVQIKKLPWNNTPAGYVVKE